MEKILSETEALHIINTLTELEQAEIKRDKVRFGEFFIGADNDNYYGVNPLNVVHIDGIFKKVTPLSASAGI